MRPSRSSLATALLLAGASFASGCSIFNSPDEIVPGGAGGGGAAGPQTATSTASATSTSTGEGGQPSPTGGGFGGGSGGEGAGDQGGGGDGGGGSPPGTCEVPGDCDVSDCEDATCEDGRCVVTPRGFGTACGPQAAECVGSGTCDGEGECFVTDLEGSTCASCDVDPLACVCRGGACETCDVFATATFFAEADLQGWETTGGWGLYTSFPRDRQSATEIPIGKQVLGTDGNRSHPYPGGLSQQLGGSLETSSALSPVTTIPAVLSFRSWHEDEGGAGSGFDSKRILVHAADTTTTLVDCVGGIASEQPFCQVWPALQTAQRSADDWDEIAIAVPAQLVGLAGRIELQYSTSDAVGPHERGWFIDALSAAGRCACATDEDCGHVAGLCAVATCDVATGACTTALRPGSQGNTCGSDGSSTCSAPDRCDVFGLCNPEDQVDGTACVDCAGGGCDVCGDGACVACEADRQSFDGLLPTAGWTLEGGWAVTAQAPASDLPAVAFFTPVFGTDGGIGGPEASTATTIPTAIPATLTFRSWHVDEGGQGGFDNKTITIVTTDGVVVPLVDCAGGLNSGLPFCLFRNAPRGAGEFDDVAFETGIAAGTIGTIVFGYDTVDPTQSFEQGWYIDDLNALRCP